MPHKTRENRLRRKAERCGLRADQERPSRPGRKRLRALRSPRPADWRGDQPGSSRPLDLQLDPR